MIYKVSQLKSGGRRVASKFPFVRIISVRYKKLIVTFLQASSHKSEILRFDGHYKFGLQDLFAGVEGDVEPGDASVG